MIIFRIQTVKYQGKEVTANVEITDHIVSAIGAAFHLVEQLGTSGNRLTDCKFQK